jgi:queuine tRNA-ribosyltransferase
MIGVRLCTLHNLHFFLDLLARARRAIEAERFGAFRDEILSRYPRSPQGGSPSVGREVP